MRMLRAAIDEDGQHVWVEHECNGQTVRDMLPWPTWQKRGDEISPSVNCLACGTHGIAYLESPPT